jgi:K+-transporting ATPase ATPase C chain
MNEGQTNMWNQLRPAFLMMLVMTVLTGLIYPVVLTGVSQVLFRDQANGSLVSVNGQVVGSRLIAQGFTKPEYFHPRPSAAGSGYDPTASAGTNLGPTSAKLINGTIKGDDKKQEVVDFPGIKDRIVNYCVENDIPYTSSEPLDKFRDARGNLDDVKLISAFNDPKAPLIFSPNTPIPSDAVTTSASGLDPDISPANAALQTARVAKARGVPVERVRALVARQTRGRDVGLLGEPRVNILELNLALDRELPRKVVELDSPNR